MEELCLQARNKLQIALHVFSPRTKTRSAMSHSQGLQEWGDVLVDALQRGVKISLLLNDFDPVGAPHLHASVWERITMLDEAVATLAPDKSGNLELLVAHPGGQTGALVRTALWPFARREAQRIRGELMSTGRALPPGLKAQVPFLPALRNFTQTLHQKFLIADGERAIVGGLDIDERRFDNTAHKLEAHETWHDVSAEICGQPAADLASHFNQVWRRVSAGGHTHAAAYLSDRPHCVLNFAVARRSKAVNGGEDLSNNRASEPRIVRTLSSYGRSPVRFGPVRDVVTMEQAHLDMIKQASCYIYIENQFFRSSAIRDALAAELQAKPQLVAIVLLPGAPEEVAYQGDTSPVHRYGEWLQMRALNKLKAAFPERFLCFALTGEVKRTEVFDRDALFGKSMVYIHSKVLIVDDQHAIVSSANLNGRSMAWDVEAGIAFNDAVEVSQLRRKLWKAHLGSDGALLEPGADIHTSARHWVETAIERRDKGATGSAVGPVPFPFKKTRKFAKRHILIPENMV